jgi:lysophospholipase L1-like esterase
MPQTRFRRALVNLCLLVAGLMAAFAAGEGMVRLVAPQSLVPAYWEEAAGVRGLRANLSARYMVPKAWDFRFTTDEHGFRPGGPTVSPSRDAKKLVLLGDSFTFGMGANDSDTYPARLEQALGVRARVVNAGVPGTGTGEQAMYYDRVLSRERPDVVLLNMTWTDLEDDEERPFFTLDSTGRLSPRKNAGNDSRLRRGNGMRRVARSLPGYDWLSQHSELFNLARAVALEALQPESLKPAACGSAGFDKQTQLMKGELEWLRQRVERDGAKLAIVLIPGFEETEDRPSPWATPQEARCHSEAIAQVLQQLREETQLPSLDLRPAMKEQAQRERVFYPEADTHPTPQGYRFIAAKVAAFLSDSHLLDTPR